MQRKRVLFLQKKLLEERRREINAAKKARGKKVRACWVRPLLLGHDTLGPWATTIPLMKEQDTEKFYSTFRMTPKAFDTLLDLVGPHLGKQCWRKPICPGERLAIFLRYDTSNPLNLKSQNSKFCVTQYIHFRYVVSGQSFVSLEIYFLVSEKTISNIVFEVGVVLWTVLKPLVFQPLTTEMWLRVASEFEAMWDLLHCLGAIDGTHIKIYVSSTSTIV